MYLCCYDRETHWAAERDCGVTDCGDKKASNTEMRPSKEGSMSDTIRARLARFAASAAIALAATLSDTAAQASGRIVARIDISEQRMEVEIDGRTAFRWKVSTARKGYVTPVGTFRPTRLERMWYSRKYDMSPMPHSVFFRGGYAVHATDAIKRLGTPASHGCIRLHPNDAADFFQLVETYGPQNTRIVITR
jgi:lipoprotein-anchoring transpeptidase ErfK/SrfK